MTLIWKQYIPPKHSFILWLAMRGRLNTKNLWIEKPDDASCVFCKRHPETISHLFFRSSFVQAIWNRVRNWLNIHKSMTTLLSTVKWIKKEYRGAMIITKSVTLAFAAMVYFIWSSRNKILFAGASILSSEILKSIQVSVMTVLYDGIYGSSLSFCLWLGLCI